LVLKRLEIGNILWHRDCSCPLIMKAAVSHSNGRISPVFDVSENLLLLDIEQMKEMKRENIIIGGKGIFEKARELSNLGVSVLICGAISGELEKAVSSTGIDVRGFVCGEIEAIISAFTEKRLDDARFMMPGCCSRRRMHRHGHCCRKNTTTIKRGGIENA